MSTSQAIPTVPSTSLTGAAPTSASAALVYEKPERIAKEIKCAYASCGAALVDPVAGKCGDMVCAACAKPGEACPACRAPFEAPQPVTVRAILAMLDALMVVCPGCKKSVPRPQYKAHVWDCPVPCPQGCVDAGGKIFCVAPSAQARHEAVECGAIHVRCPAHAVFCPWRRARSELAGHLIQCDFFRLRAALEPILVRIEHLERAASPAKP